MMSQLEPVIYYFMKEYTNCNAQRFEELYFKGDLQGMFNAIRKVDLMDVYKGIFEYIPDNMKYETFLTVYTRSELNFNKLTIKILEALKKLRPENIIKELSEHADEKGFITIYRGECTRSATVKKSLSWSLDKECAEWFAKRFLHGSNVGYVHEGKVNIKDVIGFTQARKESEVIVRFKYVELLSKTPVLVECDHQRLKQIG